MPDAEVKFRGPYCLYERAGESDAPLLFADEEASLLRGGVYILAWRHEDLLYPYYIGETQGVIADRLVAHMQGFLSGAYWIPNPKILSSACESGSRPKQEQFYLYKPKDFKKKFLHRLEHCALMDSIIELLAGFRCFVAEVEDPTKERLKGIEKHLTQLCYEELNGRLKVPIIDSPRDNGAEPFETKVSFPSGYTIVGLS